ncbi:hypothetical protein B0H17DRAFT_1060058 [Mycena rosella]|uniref:Uncharacterized protein n=1 Tax=Mycena rosella TaxID=1033263 RepID=A0AAD7DKC7_MYCRO|nr:hypothetical protein B0H17DRAFT_1060058 [Mycena rosella]
MLCHTVRAFAASVSRVDISLKISGWAAPPLYWTKKYTTSSPEVATAKPPLPAAPEASAAPLVQSDFTQYLEPLYKYGWAFSFSSPAIEGNSGLSFLWRRFLVSSLEELGALCECTRTKPCDIELFPNLETKILLRSPDGASRSMIRHALELETSYQTICPGAPPGYVKLKLEVKSPDAAQALAQATPYHPPHTPRILLPIIPTPLPSPPSAPPFPPPSIAEADLETYVKPLILNGWGISPFGGTKVFNRQLSLRRTYRFYDYSTAQDFFRAVITVIPTPAPVSSVTAALRMRSSPNPSMVWLALNSKLTEDAWGVPKYGISHADVRLAIEIETEFLKNWAGKADNVAVSRLAPTTMKQVWEPQGPPSS